MLTEIKIKSLLAKPSRYSAFDRDGLYLEIMTTGAKYWRRKHVENCRTIKRTIGPWPLISLKEARELNQ